VELVQARNDLRHAKVSNDGRPNTLDISFRTAAMKPSGLETTIRWALWKSLERIATPFLDAKVASPTLLVRFAKLQEVVVRLAREDMRYISEAAQVILAGTPQDIELLRTEVDAGFCEFSAEFATTAWPLPAPFNAGPFSRIIPTPGKIVCK